MASQFAETRSERVVFLVSAAEKRRIADNARAASMTLSDYVRTAAERYAEPTDAERALMSELLVMLEEANARTDASLARLAETEARAVAFDEDIYRAQVRAEFESRGDLDWSAVAAELGYERA